METGPLSASGQAPSIDLKVVNDAPVPVSAAAAPGAMIPTIDEDVAAAVNIAAIAELGTDVDGAATALEPDQAGNEDEVLKMPTTTPGEESDTLSSTFSGDDTSLKDWPVAPVLRGQGRQEDASDASLGKKKYGATANREYEQGQSSIKSLPRHRESVTWIMGDDVMSQSDRKSSRVMKEDEGMYGSDTEAFPDDSFNESLRKGSTMAKAKDKAPRPEIHGLDG